ncbi:MAG: hypothetical protein ACRYFX_03575 [Janthinobacterium lividum]
MKKFCICFGFVGLTILLAGVYGVVHDQITYSISPEYFTRFKYEQFGFEPAWFGGHRPTVALIGLLATWWVGLFIGVIFGLLGLLLVARPVLVSTLFGAVRRAFGTTLVAGVIGYFYGRFVLAKTGVSWWLPDNLQQPADFITVGAIHNFGYGGALVGLLAGVVYILQHRRPTQASLASRRS